jgi:hypothetical protein
MWNLSNGTSCLPAWSVMLFRGDYIRKAAPRLPFSNLNVNVKFVPVLPARE